MDKLNSWIDNMSKTNGKNYKYYYIDEKKKQKVIAELSSLDYTFVGNEIDLRITRYKGAKLPQSNRAFWLYKSAYWRDGIMHHEDVLYFSYLILSRAPRLLEFISNKYPYIFIDEFQDTTELQTWIVDRILSSSTKIGIVGDLAQSIYRFAGAKRSDFLRFGDGSIDEYKLSRNHRSTGRIIDFLNKIRTDIKQENTTNTVDGNPVLVLVGPINDAINWCKGRISGEDLTVLTRNNAMASNIDAQVMKPSSDLIESLYREDENIVRALFIHAILKGFRYYRKDDFRNALNEILRVLNKACKTCNASILKIDVRRIAIKIIDSARKESTLETPVRDFYLESITWMRKEYGIKGYPSLRSGNASAFYQLHRINDMLPFVKIDTRIDDLERTIHSAKGSQFKNVLVWFEKSDDFKKYILEGSKHIDEEDEEGRIYYVACSRAMSNLFINIPDIKDDDIKKIQDMGIDCIILKTRRLL
jgi:DNA helicase-2/ATP-dependent DNA helicase PcrA